MKKNTIKLNESQLNKIIVESVKKVLKEFSTGLEKNIPEKLYHATIKQKLPSIKKFGLGGKIPRNRFWDYEGTEYEKIKQGFFVDVDPDNAYSYVDSCDEIYDRYEDFSEEDIILFEIDRNDLDLSKLSVDKNDTSNFDDDYDGIQPHSYFYDGVVPFNKLKKINYY